ncbi:MAG: S24 family peptidase [Methylococcaceae bacterium]
MFNEGKHNDCLIADNNPVEFAVMDIKTKQQKMEQLEAFNRLVSAILEKGMEIKDFRKKLLITSQKWNNWKNRGLPFSECFKMADALGINPDWLASGKGVKYLNKREEYEKATIKPGDSACVPVIGSAQLEDNGEWSDINKNDVGGFINYPTYDQDAYAMMCVGDKMKPRIRGGEFLIIEPNRVPQPGDDVAIKSLAGKVMVKTLLYIRDGMVHLLSINESHAPQAIPEEKIDKMCTVLAIANKQSWVKEQ